MKLDDKVEELRAWIKKGGTITDFAALHQVDRRTVQRFMASKGLYADFDFSKPNLKNILLTKVSVKFSDDTNSVFISPTDLVNGVPTIIVDSGCDDHPDSALTATGWINDIEIFSGEIIGKYCITGINLESLDLETVLCNDEHFVLIPPYDSRPNYSKIPTLARLECKIFGDKVVLFYVTEHEGIDENSLNYNCIGFVDDKGIFVQRVSVISPWNKKDGLNASAMGSYLR